MLIYKAFTPFRCTSVPSWGGVRSGGFSRTGDSFHNLQGHIIPILYNAVKDVLRLFYFVGLISLHRHNKATAQGKTQNHNAEIVSHTYKRKESAVHFSLLKF